MKTLLFALTGLGNPALKFLAARPGTRLAGLVTVPKPAGPFPYYPCPKIHDEAAALGVPVFEGLRLRRAQDRDFIKGLGADLLVVASFNQIIPADIIGSASSGVINLHPSLLPAYGGPTPTFWTLLNGEKESGITAHLIEDETLDSGRILAQSRLQVEETDNDGTLRRKLAELSVEPLAAALDLLEKGGAGSLPPQDRAKATYYPKYSQADRYLDPARPLAELRNRLRALTPYPGALLSAGGRDLAVKAVAALGEGEPCPEGSVAVGRLAFRLA